jgi:hypothetical protein
MAVFELAVPGYAAVPDRTGPGIFENVRDDLHWSDVHGLPSPTDIQFLGLPGVVVNFQFPFVVPVFFGTGPPGTGKRMTVSEVFVTFYVHNTIPKSTVRLTNISVFDRLKGVFHSADLDMPELAGQPPGSGGQQEGPDRFADDTVLERNYHVFTPPRYLVRKSLGVEARVDFGADGGIVGFTGAGLKLEST